VIRKSVEVNIMSKLKLVDFQGNHLATITQDDSGELSFEVVNEVLEEELKSLFISIEKEPHYLTLGTYRAQNKQVVRQTLRKKLEPGDPDFLRGVKDQITRQKVEIGGKRIRGLLIDTIGGK
jgi:hypothetical protein